jgi:glycine dehydrogenase subunit 1
MAKRGILAGVPVSRFYPDNSDLANLLLVTATEMTSEDDMARFCSALGEVL